MLFGRHCHDASRCTVLPLSSDYLGSCTGALTTWRNRLIILVPCYLSLACALSFLRFSRHSILYKIFLRPYRYLSPRTHHPLLPYEGLMAPWQARLSLHDRLVPNRQTHTTCPQRGDRCGERQKPDFPANSKTCQRACIHDCDFTPTRKVVDGPKAA
jgi:hypothetical protein